MFDKIIIHAVSPSGWPVDFEISPGPGKLEESIAFLQRQGFSPAPTPAEGRTVQWTPEGLPLCPKHGEVMRKREKQGDTWYSHQVTGPDGEAHYCRGYGSKSSPGWYVE